MHRVDWVLVYDVHSIRWCGDNRDRESFGRLGDRLPVIVVRSPRRKPTHRGRVRQAQIQPI